jgi:gliding motility-associated-like protein
MKAISCFCVMRKFCVPLWGGLLLILASLLPTLTFAQPSVSPAQNSIVAQATDTITVVFDNPLTSLGNEPIEVYGSRFGRHQGDVEVNGSTLRFVSDCPFRPGETVTVTLSDDAVGLLGNPYVWQFTVRSEFGTGEFSEEDPVLLDESGGETAEMANLGSVTIPSEPYAAEFNRTSQQGDLKTDVAFVNQETGQVRVLFGPDLTQSNSQTISVPNAKTLAGGDINQDGSPDLVTVNTFTDSLAVLINQGGSFSLERMISTGARPTDLVIADLNGDGAQDLAVTPFGEDEVYVHFNANNGTGAFEPPQTYSSGSAPSTLVARDIDRDGDLDLLVGSAGEESIGWLQNDGQGQFTRTNSLDLSFSPASLAANDVAGSEGENTGDGWIDLIVTAQSQDQIRLYENNGSSSFSFSQQTITSPDQPALGAALADLDSGLDAEQGIFDLDLISTHRSANSLQTIFNDTNSGYSAPNIFSVNEPVGVAGLDVERNGSQDFVVINPLGTRAQLFRNLGGRPGPVSLSGDPLLFGEICVGNNGRDTVQVENISNNEVVLSEFSSPTGFDVTTSLPDTLRPGQTASVEVTFSPDEIRSYSGTLVLQANELTKFCGEETDPINLPIEVGGTGAGTEMSATPDTLTFGEVIVGNSSTESFQVSNDGNIPAEVQDISGLEGTPFEIQSSPSTISPGSQSVSVVFSPEDPDDSYTETVELTTASKCGTSTLSVVLTGSSRPQRPDLVAEEVRVEGGTPGTINVSDTLDIFCRYSNQGGQDIEDSFDIELRRDGNSLDTFSDDALAVGESAETPSIAISFSDVGTTEIACEVDVGDALAEQDEANNTTTLDLRIERPDRLPVSPNPFTPNDDGFNDSVKFRVSEFGLGQPSVGIYAFNGRLVRTLEEVQGGVLEWNGRNKSGERLAPGTYLYVVRDGGQTIASGHVTLAR